MQNKSQADKSTKNLTPQELENLLAKKKQLFDELNEINRKLGIDDEMPVKEALKQVVKYALKKEITTEDVDRDIDIIFKVFGTAKKETSDRHKKVSKLVTMSLSERNKWLESIKNPPLTLVEYDALVKEYTGSRFYRSFINTSKAPTIALHELVKACKTDEERGELVRRFMLEPENKEKSDFCKLLWTTLNQGRLFNLPNLCPTPDDKDSPSRVKDNVSNFFSGSSTQTETDLASNPDATALPKSLPPS